MTAIFQLSLPTRLRSSRRSRRASDPSTASPPPAASTPSPPPPSPPPPFPSGTSAAAPRRASTGATGARAAAARMSRDDLPVAVKDAVFAHQAAQADALPLTAGALGAAGVCGGGGGGERRAEALHAALVRAGILRPADAQRPVDTALVGAGLVRQTKGLSLAAARALVKVLFFWEEEAVRLWVLRGEEAELRGLLEEWEARRRGGADADADADSSDGCEEESEERRNAEKMIQEVELRIRAVRMQMKLRPSARFVEGDDDELPRYEPRCGEAL